MADPATPLRTRSSRSNGNHRRPVVVDITCESEPQQLTGSLISSTPSTTPAHSEHQSGDSHQIAQPEIGSRTRYRHRARTTSVIDLSNNEQNNNTPHENLPGDRASSDRNTSSRSGNNSSNRQSSRNRRSSSDDNRRGFDLRTPSTTPHEQPNIVHRHRSSTRGRTSIAHNARVTSHPYPSSSSLSQRRNAHHNRQTSNAQPSTSMRTNSVPTTAETARDVLTSEEDDAILARRLQLQELAYALPHTTLGAPTNRLELVLTNYDAPRPVHHHQPSILPFLSAPSLFNTGVNSIYDDDDSDDDVLVESYSDSDRLSDDSTSDSSDDYHYENPFGSRYDNIGFMQSVVFDPQSGASFASNFPMGPFSGVMRSIIGSNRANESFDLDYETLLRLNEIAPEVSRGASQRTINNLPTSQYSGSPTTESTASASCNICMDDYAKGDKLKQIPRCKHAFHAKCLEPWLKINKTCPVCRSDLR